MNNQNKTLFLLFPLKQKSKMESIGLYTYSFRQVDPAILCWLWLCQVNLARFNSSSIWWWNWFEFATQFGQRCFSVPYSWILNHRRHILSMVFGFHHSAKHVIRSIRYNELLVCKFLHHIRCAKWNDTHQFCWIYMWLSCIERKRCLTSNILRWARDRNVGLQIPTFQSIHLNYDRAQQPLTKPLQVPLTLLSFKLTSKELIPF